MTPEDRVFGVAMSEGVDAELRRHLVRADGQEDLCFALWSPSEGEHRTTALVHTVVLPEAGEREVHGNASFVSAYFERAVTLAASEGCGLAFLHSHPGPGWQGMSLADVVAERDKMAGATAAL